MNVMRMEGVTKIYRRPHLGRVKETVGIVDVDLEIRQGEVFGLVGLNGSGKSTTIKLFLGLHFPTRGVVEVLGRPMPDVGALRKVGYLPEGAYLSRQLTGREIVRFFAGLSGIPYAEREGAVESILSRIGMSGSADDRGSDCSKGMLQRISMAQALVHDPDILVFDEPTGALDAAGARIAKDLLVSARDKGKLVFFTTHIMEIAERLADRIAIIHKGQLIADGKLEELRDRFGKKRNESLEDLFLRITGEAAAKADLGS